MKINDTYQAHAQTSEVGVVDHMTDWATEQDTQLYSDCVSGAKYEQE